MRNSQQTSLDTRKDITQKTQDGEGGVAWRKLMSDVHYQSTKKYTQSTLHVHKKAMKPTSMTFCRFQLPQLRFNAQD